MAKILRCRRMPEAHSRAQADRRGRAASAARPSPSRHSRGRCAVGDREVPPSATGPRVIGGPRSARCFTWNNCDLFRVSRETLGRPARVPRSRRRFTHRPTWNIRPGDMTPRRPALPPRLAPFYTRDGRRGPRTLVLWSLHEQDDVLAALSTVQDPELRRSVVDLGMVRDIEITDDRLSVRLVLTTAACPLKGRIETETEQALARRRRRAPGRGRDGRHVARGVRAPRGRRQGRPGDPADAVRTGLQDARPGGGQRQGRRRQVDGDRQPGRRPGAARSRRGPHRRRRLRPHDPPHVRHGGRGARLARRQAGAARSATA